MNNNNQEIHLKKEVLESTVRAFSWKILKKKLVSSPLIWHPKRYEAHYKCYIYKERAIAGR
jgi:hypothetical protein